MRAVSSSGQAIRSQRTAVVEPVMLWLSARHRETGLVEGVGLWEGGEVENITVTDLFTGAGQTRTFYPGAVLEIGPFRWEAGLNIMSTPARISSLSAAAIAAFYQYEPRGAEAQLWRRCYDPDTLLPVAIEPICRGYVNLAPVTRPTPGGEGAIDLEIVSPARRLTITSAMRKSHEVQTRRSGDLFRRHKATQASKDVAWGTKGRAK